MQTSLRTFQCTWWGAMGKWKQHFLMQEAAKIHTLKYCSWLCLQYLWRCCVSVAKQPQMTNITSQKEHSSELTATRLDSERNTALVLLISSLLLSSFQFKALLKSLVKCYHSNNSKQTLFLELCQRQVFWHFTYKVFVGILRH